MVDAPDPGADAPGRDVGFTRPDVGFRDPGTGFLFLAGRPPGLVPAEPASLSGLSTNLPQPL
ncbi:hypothetical protein ATE80_07635 [Streptomyces kanasensis]|uniref:Uncharacterized protein n=1 Tax=Streptomyces kanasensis TaxID=936756 RepID=A0A100Y861_9ACTN|nr:hypothetical protein ATE80_07635 [Streptomyces kanasensis]